MYLEMLNSFLTVLLFSVHGETSHKNWENIPTNCGISRFNRGNARIVNGELGELGQIPWIARLGQIEPVSQNVYFHCGGSLINRWYVISAAHCGEKSEVVRLGDNYADTNKDCDKSGVCAPPHQDFRVKRYIFEDYCRTSNINDMLVLQLDNPVQFNGFVQPICLPRKFIPHSQLANKMSVSAGWGVTSSNSSSKDPNIMRVIYNPILDLDKCSKEWRFRIREDQMCAGSLAEDKGLCFGDSGGPAQIDLNVDGVQRTYLLGVASFTTSECEIGPAVFTYIPKWIDTIISYIEEK